MSNPTTYLSVEERERLAAGTTPFPWIYPDGDDFTIWTKDGSGHGIVAHVAPWCPPSPSHLYYETTIANARLIAAAPALLAHCTEMDKREAALVAERDELKAQIEACQCLLDHDTTSGAPLKERISGMIAHAAKQIRQIVELREERDRLREGLKNIEVVKKALSEGRRLCPSHGTLAEERINLFEHAATILQGVQLALAATAPAKENCPDCKAGFVLMSDGMHLIPGNVLAGVACVSYRR